MNSILLRFTSRKFLLVIGGIIGVVALPEHSKEIITLVGMFQINEGAADIVERYTKPKATQVAIDAGVLPPGFAADDRPVTPGVPDKTVYTPS